jgi:hypothetical protein
MVAPVTGPFSRSYQFAGPPNKYGIVAYWSIGSYTWSRQRKPYSLPLPFLATKGYVDYSSDSWNNVTTVPSGTSWVEWSRFSSTLSKAYEKLANSLGESSQWANNLHERGKTIDMIVTSVTTVTKFVANVKKFRFKGTYWQRRKDHRDIQRDLKLPILTDKRFVKQAKNSGDLWLQYHFGIDPLVKDIHNGVERLLDVPQPKMVVGKGSRRDIYSYNGIPTGGSRDYDIIHSYTRQSTRIVISNENLALAEQLGLVNPLSFAWEATPFSFVVDWATNIGQVLSSFSTFAGVTTRDSSSTYMQVRRNTRVWWFGYAYGFTNVYCQRTLGLDKPVLHIRPWKDVSPVRAITAISLLLKGLKG